MSKRGRDPKDPAVKISADHSTPIRGHLRTGRPHGGEAFPKAWAHRGRAELTRIVTVDDPLWRARTRDWRCEDVDRRPGTVQCHGLTNYRGAATEAVS